MNWAQNQPGTVMKKVDSARPLLLPRGSAGNTEAPPLVTGATIVTLPNYLPGIVRVPDQFAAVGRQLVITNLAYEPDAPVTSSFAASAPAGAAITTAP